VRVGQARDGERLVTVKDTLEGRTLKLRRTVDVPAGRVQPGADYQRFAQFVRDAEALAERDLVFSKS
jgi:hypothetical protein